MKFKHIPEGCTSKMVDHYWKRTESHIALVKKYADKIFKYDPAKYRQLQIQVNSHDATKFEEDEYEPYVWLTWRYKCKDDDTKFECPEGMEDRIQEATLHHILNNRHHPELHDDTTPEDEMLNDKDRDANPDHLVDGTEMGDVDIAEMVSDWCAMSEERGNSPREWADKTVNKRWKFDDEQKALIYELIDAVWEGEDE